MFPLKKKKEINNIESKRSKPSTWKIPLYTLGISVSKIQN